MSGELTICGRKAVDSAVARHPETIRRLFFTKDLVPVYAKICKAMAAEHRIYRIVEEEELEKISGSAHHGGVAAVVPLKIIEEPGPLEIAAWRNSSAKLVFLDSLSNAHNFGAVVRGAAFLGLSQIVLCGPRAQAQALISSASYRVAEGGMDHVDIWSVENLGAFMDRYGFSAGPKGIVFVAADQNGEVDLHDIGEKLLAIAATANPIGLILGNEESGIQAEIRRRCAFSSRIVGTGAIESLNVAHAATIFMFAITRI